MSTKPDYYGPNDPYQFALDNELNALEFNAIKYICRKKGDQRIRDLECALNTIQRLIKHEEAKIKATHPGSVQVNAGVSCSPGTRRCTSVRTEMGGGIVYDYEDVQTGLREPEYDGDSV